MFTGHPTVLALALRKCAMAQHSIRSPSKQTPACTLAVPSTRTHPPSPSPSGPTACAPSGPCSSPRPLCRRGWTSCKSEGGVRCMWPHRLKLGEVLCADRTLGEANLFPEDVAWESL